jgi:hypothetical protein
LPGEQRIELAGALERVQLVGAADMHLADENLRHGLISVNGTPLRLSKAFAVLQ